MRIVKFSYRKKEGWGVLKDAIIIKVLEKDPFTSLKYSGRELSLREVDICAPASPTKIVLVGLNYRRHARELKMKIPKNPILFLKPPSALITVGDHIVYPPGVKRLDYEGELALVIKKQIKNVSAHEALKSVLGYTCLNDVTARDIQTQDGQWTRAKSFDTFCPVGPWVVPGLDPRSLTLTTLLNGKEVQHSCTDDFVCGVEKLIWFISRVMTLFPGDIISTGTPQGVGPMRPGDEVTVEIEGIGPLVNTVTRP
ncbi:MAG: fumarylacetoacetate hydrolase family protein [Candidatus Omnitrophica bacterium]|nr:fumarylacetoacetate hydrolase family protein [Candidatus Omnitrophota bacterium]